jgi:ABC-type multidrug transport system fused ATPase/permease subunit
MDKIQNLSMFKILKDLFTLIEKKLYKNFLYIQLLIIISGTIEIISFFSILPFVSIILNPDIILSGIGLVIYNLSGLETAENFIFITGIVIVVALILSSLLSILRMWYTTKFAEEVGFKIGDNLFLHYLRRDYEFHIFNNSSYLTKQITFEIDRVKKIMNMVMAINSNIFMGLIIIVGMIIYDWQTTIIIIITIILIYFLLHMKVGTMLQRNGRSVSSSSKDRFKIISNTFGEVSDIIMSDRSGYFYSKMKKTSKILVRAITLNEVLATVPVKVIQGIILGALVLIILYSSTIYDDVNPIIMSLSAFIMAGYKLLPIFQGVYSSMAKIKSNGPAIESIVSDFSKGDDYISKANDYKDKIKISGDIMLSNVSYTYRGQSEPTINNINVHFQKGKRIGIVGKSGSGKTTLIKLIISLIYPSKGELRIDRNLIDRFNAHLWKMNIALISQDIFLIDGTISENIAFGHNEIDVNIDKVKECIKRAQLEKYITSLPNGIQTEVGERGIQLSGGQKQRIGIARAIYNDAEFLIMDEATSALDKINEKKIIEEIVSNNTKLTVIMIAHRITTLKDFDLIYVMESGKITEQGTYKNLIANSNFFKKMNDIK